MTGWALEIDLREGGPGSGNFAHKGIPGQRGGSVSQRGVAEPPSEGVRLTRHALARMRERGKFQSVRETMKQLEGKQTPEGPWFCEMQRKGKLDGYLVGEDGVVKTVLGSWYNPANLKGEAVSLSESLWWLLAKWIAEGSDLSGNWGHQGVPGSRGGSAPGGGHAKLGVASNASREERQAVVSKRREERNQGKGPTTEPDDFLDILGGSAWERYSSKPAARVMGAGEKELADSVAEGREAYATAVKRYGAESTEARAIKDYVSSMEDELSQEVSANEALWWAKGIVPGDATEQDWKDTAKALNRESMELYKKYTKDGIMLKVAEMRGAKDGGYANIGGDVVQVRRGQFSVRSAQKIEGQMWREAKGELTEEYGNYLQKLGYSPKEITSATYEQRQSLLREIGDKQMLTSGRGRPRRIDGVSPEARARIIEQVDYAEANRAAAAGRDPLALPSLDAYGKRQTAERILATHVEYSPVSWQEAASVDWGL